MTQKATRPNRRAPYPPEPSPPDHGDASADATFMAVGRALSAWEYLEAHLGLIFGFFVGSKHGLEPAQRAYGAIASFTNRIEMLEAAADAYFALSPDEQGEQDLKDLIKDTRHWAANRNAIAHGIVQPYVTPEQKPDGYALVPSWHATKKRKIMRNEVPTPFPVRVQMNYSYTSPEILRFSEVFNLLATRASNYHMRMIRLYPK